MKTNELKRGDDILLSNGWKATIWDNAKGNRRMAKVFGWETEIGSVYAHDIAWMLDKEGVPLAAIEHTKEQNKLRVMVNSF